MKYKFGLSTYHIGIIEAFSTLRNKKSQFVEQALIQFLATKKGRDTLRLMTQRTIDIPHKSVRRRTPLSEQAGPEKEGSDKISVDSFLS